MLDVVVIGAGLSGLQAALGLQAEGLSILVVEARSRVGGKSWSVPLASGRGCVELGGAWINDTNQHRMFSYAQRFGLELVKQNVDGDCVMDGIGGALHRFPYGESPRVSVYLTSVLNATQHHHSNRPSKTNLESSSPRQR